MIGLNTAGQQQGKNNGTLENSLVSLTLLFPSFPVDRFVFHAFLHSCILAFFFFQDWGTMQQPTRTSTAGGLKSLPQLATSHRLKKIACLLSFYQSVKQGASFQGANSWQREYQYHRLGYKGRAVGTRHTEKF